MAGLPTAAFIPSELPAGLENDPDVVAAVKKLALRAIESATDLLESGAPSIQLQMIRAVLPSVTKALANRVDGGDDELKQRVEGMYAMLLSGLGGGE